MQTQELSRQVQRLEALFSKAAEASNGDLSLQGHWARYLCVLVAGFIENCIKEIYSDFATRSASPHVAGYASFHLNKVQNPRKAKVCEIVGTFNPAWRAAVESFLEEDGRGDAVDSIMNNRNQIAHGKDVGITLATVRTYFDKVVAVFTFIETQCGTAHET